MTEGESEDLECVLVSLAARTFIVSPTVSQSSFRFDDFNNEDKAPGPCTNVQVYCRCCEPDMDHALCVCVCVVIASACLYVLVMNRR